MRRRRPRPASQRLGQQRPDPHGEDHHRQHDRRLIDGVADQVAAQRDQGQLVDEAAGGADEDGGEHGRPANPPPGTRGRFLACSDPGRYGAGHRRVPFMPRTAARLLVRWPATVSRFRACGAGSPAPIPADGQQRAADARKRKRHRAGTQRARQKSLPALRQLRQGGRGAPSTALGATTGPAVPPRLRHQQRQEHGRADDRPARVVDEAGLVGRPNRPNPAYASIPDEGRRNWSPSNEA